MPKPATALIASQESPPIVITFGGGKNSRVRPLDIEINECVTGQNFDLDNDELSFRPRKAFDLVATAPNAAAIQGWGEYLPVTGTPSMIVQAGGNVYSWDGASTFSLVGTCNTASQLRGVRTANFNLLGHVLVTDLQKLTNVSTWDGATFADLAHNLTGTLQAKFCHVENERALFANVTNIIDAPQVVLASAVDDDTDLTTSNRPTSSIGADSSWFLPVSDLRPINGLEHGFGQLIFSTENGSLHRLTGSNSFDYALEDFYNGSNVSGTEALVNIGNDIVLGLRGRIETLSGTINFGDVETDDLTSWIKPDVQNVTDWRIVYDQRLQKVYFFPNNMTQVFVLHKSLLKRSVNKYQSYDRRDVTPQGLSPWSVWKTDHIIGFQPTTVWSCIDPQTMLDAVYMGDQSGNIYKLDGSRASDGASSVASGSNITSSRTSMIFRVPDAEAFDVTGWITYAKSFACTVTLTMQFGGISQFDQAITISLPNDTTVPVYNGNAYYGGPYYYSAAFGSRLTRQNWKAAGKDFHLQCKVEVTGAVDFNISEIGLRFSAVNQATGAKR